LHTVGKTMCLSPLPPLARHSTSALGAGSCPEQRFLYPFQSIESMNTMSTTKFAESNVNSLSEVQANTTMEPDVNETLSISRRKVLQLTGASAGLLAAPALIRAQTSRPKEITIGTVCSLSGAGGPFGASNRNSQAIAVDRINKAGGLWGGGNGMIKIVVGDDQSKPDVMPSEFARIARDKNVVAMLTGTTGISTLQATTEAERQRVVMISPASPIREISSRGLKYVFTHCNNSDGLLRTYFEQTKSIVEAAGKTPERVGYVFENKFNGPGYSRVWSDIYPKVLNWKFAGEYPYDPATADFAPLVSRLKADKIDFPILSVYPQDAILLIRAMREQNYAPLAISGPFSTLTLKNVLDALGKDINFVMGHCPYVAEVNLPENVKFVEEYKVRYKMMPDVAAGMTFNTITVLLDAIRRAASPSDRDSVREAMLKTKMTVKDGLIIPGGVEFDSKQLNTKGVGAYYQIMNGELRVIYPKEYATGTVVYPRPAWS